MKKASLVVLLACASVCWGQEQYTAQGSYGTVNNDSNCPVHGCFLPVTQYSGGSQIQLQQISSGHEFTLGVDASHNVWQLPLAANAKTIWQSWAPASGLTVYETAARSQSEVWLLVAHSACSPTGTHLLMLWNGSTVSSFGTCLNHISITGDDTLIGLWNTGGNNGAVWYARAPSFGWTKFGTGWTKVVGAGSTEAFGIMNSTLYVLNLTNNTYAAVPNTSSVKDVAVTADRWLTVLTASANSSGNVYMMDLTASPQTWVQMKGTLTNIYGGSHLGIFGTDSNHYPYHYLAIALTATVNLWGNYNCGPGGGGCPPGSMHTLTATSQFPHGYNSGVASFTTQPENNGSVTATDVSGTCDLFFGDPTSTECKPKVSIGQVVCSVMAGIFLKDLLSSPPSYSLQEAYSRMITASAPSCSRDISGFGPQACLYPVVPYCSNTTLPALDPKFGEGYEDNDYAMDMSELCWRFDLGPLVCGGTAFQKWSADEEFPTDPGTKDCTLLVP